MSRQKKDENRNSLSFAFDTIQNEIFFQDVDDLSPDELTSFRDMLEDKISWLDDLEPSDEQSDVYEDWADMHEDLEDILDEVIDRLDSMKS